MPRSELVPALPLRFAIFASGRGSNAEALMDAFESQFIPAELSLVVSNKSGAEVLQHAERRGYTQRLIPHRSVLREAHEALLLKALTEARVHHVLLAGYMRVLTPYFLQNFWGKVINIHPALLPDYPGLEAAERQWRDGVAVAGATVHFVDEGVDTGPTLLQGSLIVRGDEGEQGLQRRILEEVEHVIYPRAVRLFIDRTLRENP